MRKEKKYIYIEEGILTIPKNITIHGIKFKSNQITKFAFRGLMLEEIIIPDSVTDIGFKAFSYNDFTSVTFKRRDITGDNYDDNAFAEVYSKPTLYIPAGAVGYPEPGTTPVRWLGTLWSSVVEIEDEKNPEGISDSEGPIIIDSVSNTGNYDQDLESVTIPESVTTIDDSAFAKNKLTCVTIPESVTYIGDYAFYGNELRSVTIPESVTYIGMGAFLSNFLTSVTIGSSVTYIGESAFAKNYLTCVTIPAFVTIIGDAAFASNSLESVTFKRIDITGDSYSSRAFAHVSSKPTLYIPAGAVGYPEPSTTPVVWLGTLWSSVIEMEEEK